MGTRFATSGPACQIASPTTVSPLTDFGCVRTRTATRLCHSNIVPTCFKVCAKKGANHGPKKKKMFLELGRFAAPDPAQRVGQRGAAVGVGMGAGPEDKLAVVCRQQARDRSVRAGREGREAPLVAATYSRRTPARAPSAGSPAASSRADQNNPPLSALPRGGKGFGFGT